MIIKIISCKSSDEHDDSRRVLSFCSLLLVVRPTAALAVAGPTIVVIRNGFMNSRSRQIYLAFEDLRSHVSCTINVYVGLNIFNAASQQAVGIRGDILPHGPHRGRGSLH